jgi:hypothetical protein
MNSTNLIEDLRLLSPPRFGGWLALGIAGVLAFGFFLLVRRHLRRATVDADETLGPALWDVALAELERLTTLLNREHSRDYAIQSTSILRSYIEARYALKAPTLATEEFLVMAGESPTLPADHRASLREFLELCDLMKFGRYLALAIELEALHAAAVAFVLASRPASSPNELPEGPA